MLFRKILPTAIGLVLMICAGVAAQQTTSQTPVTSQDNVRPKAPDGFRRGRMKQRKRVAGRELREGLKKLNLSDDQKRQRQAIVESHLPALKAQREQLFQIRERRMEGNLTAEDKAKARSIRQELRASRDDMRSQMRNALTTEQRTQLDELEQQRKQRRQEMMRQRQDFRTSRPQQ